jgi:ATP synthase protein I
MFLGGVGMAPQSKDKSPGEGLRSAGLLLTIPTLLIVAPLVGFFVGSWLDGRFKCGPWLGILGLAVVFAAAGRETYLIYRRYQAEDEEEKKTRR